MQVVLGEFQEMSPFTRRRNHSQYWVRVNSHFQHTDHFEDFNRKQYTIEIFSPMSLVFMRIPNMQLLKSWGEPFGSYDLLASTVHGEMHGETHSQC